jgi:retron-type reverse transcriptase
MGKWVTDICSSQRQLTPYTVGLGIDDKPFLGLIDTWLKAGILERDGMVIHPHTETPQGGVISPILANIYLHYALDLWFEQRIKPRCEGQSYLIRFADDIVCTFQYRSEAEAFYRELPGRLNKFSLAVAPEKTCIHLFRRSQRRSLTWPTLKRLLERFAFPGPTQQTRQVENRGLA